MKSIFLRAALAASSLGLCLAAAAQNAPGFLLGSPVQAAAAQRSITIGADTPWVEVVHGEAVRFVGGATEFAWQFDGTSTRAFDLREVAPAGALSRRIPVYVRRPTGHPSS